MNTHEAGWARRAAAYTAGAILMVAVGAGCGPYRGPQAHLRRGDRFFKDREFEKATIEYLNVARVQPTNGVAMLRLGLSYFGAGKVKEALPALLYARQCGTDTDELAMKLAVIYLWAGQHAKARSEILAVLERQPASLDALLLLADASREPHDLEDALTRLRAHEKEFASKSAYHIALGDLNVRARDLAGAARAYQAAIETDPESADGYMQMAGLYAMQGDTNHANIAFEKAASLAPANSVVHLQWASFNVAQGRRKEARAILERAISASTDFPQAQLALADIAVQEQRIDAALEICDSILKKHPSSTETRLLHARIFLSQGKTSDASRECERVLSAYPESTEAMHLLALVNLQQRNITKATSLLSQAVAANPDFAAAVLLLAELNLKAGHPESVIASLPAFIEKNPRLPQPYILLGMAYRSAKKCEKAVALYRRMAEIFPKDPLGLQLLGTSLVEAGEETEATAKFAAALELRPDFVEPLAMLAAQDIRLRKDQAGAMARVERQIQSSPGTAGLYDLLGRIHVAAKDPAKAEAAFRRSLELRPDSVGTLVALGRIYGMEGKTQEALASLDHALSVNSNDVAATVLSAALLQQTQRFEAARDRFERVLVIAPMSVVAANNLAYLYSERFNKQDRAYKLGMLARELAPHDPFVADTLGWILCRRGEWKWALGLLQESADQLENQPEVQYHLAVCHATMGDDAGARDALTRALESEDQLSQAASAKRLLSLLETDPATLDKDGLHALESLADDALLGVPALARAGRAHELANRREPARSAYQKVIDRYAQHPAALLGLARLKSLDGDSAAVMDLAQKAREAAPDDPVIGLMAGRLTLRHGGGHWALGVLQEAASRLPDDPEAKYALALARFDAGQVHAAHDLVQAALQSARAFDSRKEAELFSAVSALWSEPGSDGTAVLRQAREALAAAGTDWLPALALQARAEALQNDTAAEVRTLERIAVLSPDFAPALLRLAEIYAGRSKDEEKAYKLAVRARELLPCDPATARILGLLAYRKKDVQGTDQLLTEAAKSLPLDAEVAFYLGLARHQIGDKAEARRLIEKALAVRVDFPEIAAARSILAEPQTKK